MGLRPLICVRGLSFHRTHSARFCSVVPIHNPRRGDANDVYQNYTIFSGAMQSTKLRAILASSQSKKVEYYVKMCYNSLDPARRPRPPGGSTDSLSSSRPTMAPRRMPSSRPVRSRSRARFTVRRGCAASASPGRCTPYEMTARSPRR